MADSPFALRLSHAADWVRCAAFRRMNATPQASIVENAADHTVRDEGTAMHWIAETLLQECNPHQRAAWAVVAGASVGCRAPNGVEITDELYEGAEFYVDVLGSYLVPWRIEEQLHARRIHEQCGGKPDAYGHSLFKPLVILPDLKGGYAPVDVFPNWQLIGYAAAILDANPTWEVDDLMFEFVIIQPRAYHRAGPVRKQTVALRDLLPYFDALRMAASIAMGERAPAVAGLQCDNCAARASCSVAHAAGMRALEVSGEPDVHDLPVAAIDYELLRLEAAKRIIEARITGLEAQAMHLIRKGEQFPSFQIESGDGRLNWIDADAERSAIAMGDLLGVNLRKDVQAITPTQAMKHLPREYMEQYARRNKGAAKLVRFKRDAAIKAFSHLKKD